MQGIYTSCFPNEPFDGHRALADAKALCKVFTESPFHVTVEHELRDTIHNAKFVKEISEFVKAGIFNTRKAEEMVDRGESIDHLRKKRRSMTTVEFKAYLKKEFGIKNPGCRLQSTFSL